MNMNTSNHGNNAAIGYFRISFMSLLMSPISSVQIFCIILISTQVIFLFRSTVHSILLMSNQVTTPARIIIKRVDIPPKRDRNPFYSLFQFIKRKLRFKHKVEAKVEDIGNDIGDVDYCSDTEESLFESVISGEDSIR